MSQNRSISSSLRVVIFGICLSLIGCVPGTGNFGLDFLKPSYKDQPIDGQIDGNKSGKHDKDKKSGDKKGRFLKWLKSSENNEEPDVMQKQSDQPDFQKQDGKAISPLS
jgi:hypothetical protein